MITTKPTATDAPAERKDEEDLKSRLMALISDTQKRPILIAVGAGLLLLVVIIIGVALSSSATETLDSIPTGPGAIFRQPSFMGALKRDPVLAMGIAIKYHLPKVIISAVVLVAIIVAVVVGVVLYSQHQEELRKEQEALAARRVEDPFEELVARPQAFFSRPLNLLVLIGGSVLVIGAIVGIVMLVRGGEKEEEVVEDPNVKALQLKNQKIQQVKDEYAAFCNEIDEFEVLGVSKYTKQMDTSPEIQRKIYGSAVFGTLSLPPGYNVRQHNIGLSQLTVKGLIITNSPQNHVVGMATPFEILMLSEDSLNGLDINQLDGVIAFIQQLRAWKSTKK